MPVDFQVFKNNLINRGIDWSDQQILDYIAAQEDKQVTQPIMQDDLSGEIFNVIQKWEYKDSERSQSHNNPGGHIWTPELEADFGAKKGKLKSAFGKIAKGKIASRPLLNKFVKMVA